MQRSGSGNGQRASKMKRLGARGARIHGEWLHRRAQQLLREQLERIARIRCQCSSWAKIESRWGPIPEFNLFPQRRMFDGSDAEGDALWNGRAVGFEKSAGGRR